MDQKHQLPLRPNVCMVLRNRQGLLFLGERHGQAGVWQFPQGGVDSNSSLEDNVLRELSEELGVEKSKFRIVCQFRSTHEYEFDNTPSYAVGKWRGQSQTFWLVDYLGSDGEITLNPADPELMNWRWCSVAEVKLLAEPKRLPGYLGPLGEYETMGSRG